LCICFVVGCAFLVIIYAMGFGSSIYANRSSNVVSIRQSSFRPLKSSAEFIFMVGLEGTGHHLLNHFLRESPSALRANELGIRNELSQLMNKLYHKKVGFLNQHCFSKSSVEVAAVHDEVVGLFRRISGAVGDEALSIPLNAEGHIREMASYPQDKGLCRPLKYPDLNLLYNVCDEADVRCKHMYIYRDPYSIVKSTTINRHFNNNLLAGIREYTTMLNGKPADLRHPLV